MHRVRPPTHRCGRWLIGGTRPSRLRSLTVIMAGGCTGSGDGAGVVRQGDRTGPRLEAAGRHTFGAGRADPRRRSGHRQEHPVARIPSQAKGRSYRVLSCRPDESEAKLSYAALADLLEGVVEESLEGLPSPQRSALEVALLRADATGIPPDQRAISTAFLGALLALASESPTVVAIDDTPWLDAPSARVLEFAIRRLNDAPIGLVMTARSQELESLPLGLGRALPDDRIQRVMVGPMTLQATRNMLSSRVVRALPAPPPASHLRGIGREPVPGSGTRTSHPSTWGRTGTGRRPSRPVEPLRPRHRSVVRALRSG